MCGIVGVISPLPLSNADRDDAHAAHAQLTPRGPDESGVNTGDNHWIGHRRLSIIDPKGGKQPWVGKYDSVLSYNGEIYNYPELMTSHGLPESSSDTDCLGALLDKEGVRVLSELNGIFAFAYYDQVKNKLILARDHVGAKPLYYSIVNNQVYFASSMGALMCFQKIPRILNRRSCLHYMMTVRTNLGAETLVNGIKLVEPGTCLEIQWQEETIMLNQTRFYQIPIRSLKDKDETNWVKAVEGLREGMKRSVERQLISDVPLGGFLSGGLDSSILSKEATRLKPDQFHAYAIGIDEQDHFGKSYQEWPYVRTVATHLNMSCKEVHMSKTGYLEDFNKLVAFKGEPLSTPNEVAIYRLSRALKKDFTVVLSGEGADEIFGGYSESLFAVNDYLKSKQLKDWAPSESEAFKKALRRFYGKDEFEDLADLFLSQNSWLRGIVCKTGIADFKAKHEEIKKYYKNLFGEEEQFDPYDLMLKVFTRINLEGLLLRLDSSTMLSSVEGRIPFTDPELIDLAFNLPSSYKIDWNCLEDAEIGRLKNTGENFAEERITSKIILRESYRDELPMGILIRPKMSFPTPFQKWFKEDWKDLCTEKVRRSEFINKLISAELLDEVLDDGGLESKQILWPIYSLAVWADKFNIQY